MNWQNIAQIWVCDVRDWLCVVTQHGPERFHFAVYRGSPRRLEQDGFAARIEEGLTRCRDAIASRGAFRLRLVKG